MDYVEPCSKQKGQASLEPNHTEFIFVDDGTIKKYGGEIEFRAELEQAISGGYFAPKPTLNPSLLSQSASTTTIYRTEMLGLYQI